MQLKTTVSFTEERSRIRIRKSEGYPMITISGPSVPLMWKFSEIIYLPVIAAVLEWLLVVELVEPLPWLHEGELPAEADLLLAVAPIQGPRAPSHRINRINIGSRKPTIKRTG